MHFNVQPRRGTRQWPMLFVSLFRSVTCSIALVLTPFPLGAVETVSTAEVRFDILIQGGRIVDGSGTPWYRADVGIEAGKITRIGRLAGEQAAEVIDASGLIVAPGFIDMMGQTATPMLEDPTTAVNLLTQGITTINAGEGHSAAPLDDAGQQQYGWRTMAEYFQLLEMKGLPVNVAQTVGHTQVRRLVLGDVDRRPSNAEIEQMQALVREAMEAGAIGVSTALIYPPAVYAQTQEIALLAEVAGAFGGRYYTHMRNEGDLLLEAIDEALDIGRTAQTPVHIFHLKAAGRQNWGKMQLAIARIKAARAAGHEVTADIYPYVNNGLGIAALIHPRHFRDGRDQLLRRLEDEAVRAEIRHEMESSEGWENWFRHAGHDWNKIVIGQTGEKRYADQVGQSVAAIAQAHEEDPWDTFFQLVRAGAFALPESMTDANKVLALQQEFVSICTDVGPAGGASSASHPRGFGSFPRMLSRYVRDLGVISLERAVAQASATAANAVMAYDRGRIAEGLAADVIVFDYQQLGDRATFAAPHEISQGIKHVLVNGVPVLKEGEFTGKRPGRVLRGPGYDPSTAAHQVATGNAGKGLGHIDGVLQGFMKEHRVPGAALAITDKSRLVYAKAFGYADVATKEPVRPRSLFRIASISKPITAVAVLQLVDQQKLCLDDKVFELLDCRPPTDSAIEIDERWKQITIRHLLQHRGGWDRDASFDAMFQSVRFAQLLDVDPPAGPHAVIQAMLSQPLDFDPGERYAYSNFGYCLLGRVIEQVTGEHYEAYVKKHVLKPIGIENMHIGNTRLAGRRPGEVRYYDPHSGTSVFQQDLNQRVPHPYGAWHLEAMDSHGAWVASAEDLARFACAFDNAEECPILSPASVAAMLERPPGLAGHDEANQPKSDYYGLGWSVSVDESGRPTASHSGSLPGTNTRLIRRPDGRNIVLLFNARVSPWASRLVDAVLDDLVAAIDAVEQWPEIDLFEALQPRANESH